MTMTQRSPATLNEYSLSSMTANQVVSANQSRTVVTQTSVMLLDIVGIIAIFLGLAQQFGNTALLPAFLHFTYSGVFLMAVGGMLTLPFFFWAFKSTEKIFGKISL